MHHIVATMASPYENLQEKRNAFFEAARFWMNSHPSTDPNRPRLLLTDFETVMNISDSMYQDLMAYLVGLRADFFEDPRLSEEQQDEEAHQIDILMAYLEEMQVAQKEYTGSFDRPLYVEPAPAVYVEPAPAPPPPREEEPSMAFPSRIPEDVTHTLVFTNTLVKQLSRKRVLGLMTTQYYQRFFEDVLALRPVNHVVFRRLTMELQEAMLGLSSFSDAPSLNTKADKGFTLTLVTTLWTQTIELYTKLSVILGVREEEPDAPAPPPPEREEEEPSSGGPPPATPPSQPSGAPPPPPPPSGAPKGKQSLFGGADLFGPPKPEAQQQPKPAVAPVVEGEPPGKDALLAAIRKGKALKKVESTEAPRPVPAPTQPTSPPGTPGFNEAMVNRITGRRGAIEPEEESSWEDEEAQIPFIAAQMLRSRISPQMEAQLIGHPAFQKVVQAPTLVLKLHQQTNNNKAKKETKKHW